MAGGQQESQSLTKLPEVIERVGVVGGTPNDKKQLCVDLAQRQVEQRGLALCLDAQSDPKTEIQFRLLLRENTR